MFRITNEKKNTKKYGFGKIIAIFILFHKTNIIKTRDSPIDMIDTNIFVFQKDIFNRNSFYNNDYEFCKI